MARMEGNNQPDLLNILRKRGSGPVAPPAPVPSSPAPARQMPVLSPEEPPRSGRGPARRDAFLLAGLALVVAGLAVAVIYSRFGRAPDASSLPLQPRPAPSLPPVPAPPPVKPPAPVAAAPAAAAPGAVRVVTRAAPGTGKSFYTLALATYGGAKEAEARETCAWLRAKGRQYSDLFLYKTTNSKTGTQQYTICLGHYDRNPLSLDKANVLHAEVQRMPNASGRREFEECQFMKLEVSEP